ncbi:unnamed protein product [Rhizoctonia solani]|uniref:Uncharacterized protein n=1 Tax=Rhizoctonia solani TaxID=456999 RepID=A0A8H3AW10_9AGAM|nr:unnamed protein product [Rhizoctonia solani]
MTDTIPPHTCTWPEELHTVETRAHEIVVGTATLVEQPTYGVVNVIFCAVFQSTPPEPHMVAPQGLQTPITEQSWPPLPPAFQHSPSKDIFVNQELELEPGPEDSIEDSKFPDFSVYRINRHGCFTEGGGPDTLRMIVEVKHGDDASSTTVRLSDKVRLQLLGYFLLVRANSVDAGVMLIVKGNAYFWHYDELGGNGVTVSMELHGRYSRGIDSWKFLQFLRRWKAGEEGVRFDLP